MAKQQFQTVRGTYDILPDNPGFDFVAETFINLARQAGYGHIETPVLEDKNLFSRSVGEHTDVVEKEMYTLKDRSDNELAMRPEGTAGVMRAYIQNGLGSWPQPVKLYYFEPMFRYDRPQAGRTRQHYQLGLEIIGEDAPSADAQVITFANRLYKKLGLTQLSLQINSLGDEVCRPKYRKALVEYLQANKAKLCDTCKDRLDTNPMRVLDCKDPNCQAVIAAAPQTLNFLCKACQAHFEGVLEYLDDLGIGYELNPQLVRGLDYYTRTVFEFFGSRAGAQSSVSGGGRYDGLAELLGGKPTPAVGFSTSIERISLELGQYGVDIQPRQDTKVFVASLGEPARLAAFRLTEELLDGGVGAVGSVDKNSIQTQLGKADRLHAPYAIIIGQKEVLDKTVILRDMGSGAQEMIPLDQVVAELQKRFLVS
ncbi:MAG TPA: histidine--tRNA ligase [Candidatus Nanoarchaeia archaeon]|nr:histidine--tRNA ligase [Candidatus Nanoarchaeia archaeon]